MKRWVCPRCAGGALAPERLRADDVRAYCLPCSKRTGRLVRRACPSLDAERDRRAAARREARVDDAARTKARELAYWTVAGLDVRDVVARCWRALRPLVGDRSVPAVKLRRRSVGTSGRAWYSRVVLSFGPAADAATVWELTMHELTHCATPGAHHGVAFNKALCELAERLWGFSVPITRGYATSHALQAKLRVMFTVTAPAPKRCAKCSATIPTPHLAPGEPERCDDCAGSEGVES